MTELSTEIKTLAIVTYTDVHYLITAEQESKLHQLTLDGEFRLDGNMIKAKNIADVLTIEKYYETYPERKPDPMRSYYPNANTYPDITRPRKNLRDWSQEYVDSHPNEDTPKTRFMRGYLNRKSDQKSFEPKYKTYEQAKVAGVKFVEPKELTTDLF